MFIIDTHLDLSTNAIEWNRDLTQTVDDIRKSEANLTDKIDRGRGTVAFPEMRRGQVGLVVATQLARYNTQNADLPGAGWNSPEQAWAMSQAQLAWYQAMEYKGQMTQIHNLQTLEEHIKLWLDDSIPKETKPIGYILSLEGADSLLDISYLEKAYNYGLRMIGASHYSTGRYAYGTGTTEGFTAAGFELLKKIEALNMVLDITHLTDLGFSQAIDRFKGHIWASHHNCRALVPHQRQLTDEQIKILAERGSVIGACFDSWMLKPNFIARKSNPAAFGIKIENVVDHFDHICQLLGTADHCAIGSDLDGTFGTEQCPADLDTIADLQNLQKHLKKRGYTDSDIENIFYKNALNFIRRAWS
jgi:membrane dipeptidase